MLETFADEATQMAEQAARAVVKLERAAAAERGPLRDSLARIVHNLKGAAASLGQDLSAEVCHGVETVLSKQSAAAPLASTIADLVLEALDAVANHARADAAGNSAASTSQLQSLLERVANAGEAPPEAADAEAESASRSPRAKEATRSSQVPTGQGQDTSSGASRTQPASASSGAAGARGAPRRKGQESSAAVAQAGADAAAHPAESSESDAVTLRVPAVRVDAVISGAEELHLLRARLDARAATMERLLRAVDKTLRLGKQSAATNAAGGELVGALKALKAMATAAANDSAVDAQTAEALTQSLSDDIRSLRTVPAATLLDVLERSVRDHARKVGKDAVVTFDGRAVELDRALLDELKGPLTHLLRNAVDHGIEAAELRKARNKPAIGTISVQLRVLGDLLRVQVEDDGGGVKLQDVRDRAVALKLLTREQADASPEAALHELLFSTGFSTAKEITATSGRGVGLDIVREAVARLRGTVKLESQHERGARFTLLVPMTVSSTHGLMVRAAGETYVLPSHAVHAVAAVPRTHIREVRGLAFLTDGERLVPLERLASAVGHSARPAAFPSRVPVVTLSSAAGTAAFAVDDYDDEVELLVKPPGEELRPLRHLAGVAVTGSGDAVLVLDPDHLVRGATGRTGLPEPGGKDGGPKTVLVVDDSATTRLLHRGALEAAGFRVLTAADGDEALRISNGTRVDAVVSDIRMPRMDGFALTRALRQQPKHRVIPILLCSSLNRDEDRRDALASGASDLLSKAQWQGAQLAARLRELLSEVRA